MIFNRHYLILFFRIMFRNIIVQLTPEYKQLNVHQVSISEISHKGHGSLVLVTGSFGLGLGLILKNRHCRRVGRIILGPKVKRGSGHVMYSLHTLFQS